MKRSQLRRGGLYVAQIGAQERAVLVLETAPWALDRDGRPVRTRSGVGVAVAVHPHEGGPDHWQPRVLRTAAIRWTREEYQRVLEERARHRHLARDRNALVADLRRRLEEALDLLDFQPPPRVLAHAGEPRLSFTFGFREADQVRELTRRLAMSPRVANAERPPRSVENGASSPNPSK